ncbi:MAG: trigger factor family protein, partial [Bacteroidota bacterium]
MEIGLHKASETEGIIKINLSREDFQPAVDQKVKELSKTVNLKGFRPGKVPAGMIRKLYGTSLIVEQLNKVVSGQLNDYLKNSETQFLGEPMPVEKEESID